MSDTIKIPFDSIPLDGAAGGTTLADLPRPSFTRSTPDVSVGLLPPTRKPVGVTLPDPMPPLPPAPTDTPAANPMASTPPPKAGSVRSFLWDLVRPTRTKWAILAGGVSLFAGAYGLNLFVPTPAAAPKKPLPETAKLDAPAPKVTPERQVPWVGEERNDGGVRPVKHTELAPAPLPLAPTPTPLPVLEPLKPTGPEVRGQAPDPAPLPVPLPIKPLVTDQPGGPVSGGPLPIPPIDDKTKSVPLPAVVLPGANDNTVKADPPPLPSPLPPADDKKAVPLPSITPIDPKKVDPVPTPTPGPFAEVPDPKKTDTALPPVDVTKIPVPEVKPIDLKPLPTLGDSLPPVNDPKTGPLPSPGELVVKPREEAPKPIAIDPKTPVVPIPEPKKVDPAQPFVERTPPPVTPVGGTVREPSITVSVTPPKKGFEVDVVRVRSTDTYASISEAYYQSKKYAAALRAFNGDADIGRLEEVEVPPLHELQKVPGGKPRDVEPVGDGRPVRGPVLDPSGEGDPVDWGPAGRRRPAIKYESYTTPKEGMTARDVARAVYADENEWAKLIGPRGMRLRADDQLPKGTQLTVPREDLWK